MNVGFLNPFVEAAYEVIKADAGFTLTRQALSLEKEAYQTDDLTVIISLVGQVEGNVFFGMSAQTALVLVSAMLHEECRELDSLASSGIAELANVITGRASLKLAETGYQATISPPAVLKGKGTTISALDYTRLVVPLTASCGTLTIHLALRARPDINFDLAVNPTTTNRWLG